MDSFEIDVKKGLYNINDELIIKNIEHKYLVYFIDYKTKRFFRAEVDNDFDCEANYDIYLYDYLLFKACSLDFTEVCFSHRDELEDYVKINLLNEYTVEDFCGEIKHKKTYKRIDSLMRFLTSNVYDLLKLICVLSVISIFIYFINNKAIFMLNSIYGESMKPTLKTYSAGVVVYPYHLNYGDLVACRKTVDGTNMNFLKRVIALPGDRVEIIDDVVYVNGKMIQEAYLASSYRTSRNQTISFETIWKKTTEQELLYFNANHIPETIPANYYFVLGDNRKDSYDSRDFGLVYFDEIVGEYIFTLFTI